MGPPAAAWIAPARYPNPGPTAQTRSSDRPYAATLPARAQPQPCSDRAPDSDVTALAAPFHTSPAPGTLPEPTACRSVQFTSAADSLCTSRSVLEIPHLVLSACTQHVEQIIPKSRA